MVQLTLLLMGIIAVADPLFVRFVYGKHPGFFEQVGANPFQFWLLMNSSLYILLTSAIKYDMAWLLSNLQWLRAYSMPGAVSHPFSLASKSR